MWFVEQFDSFLNLGICKEYPNMTRSKSTSGGKSSRSNPSTVPNAIPNTNTNTNKDQLNNSNPANIPDVNAVTAGTTAAEAAAEVKVAPEPRKLGVVKTEPRKNAAPSINLFPINLEDEIRRRAYELYLQRGTAPGGEAEDWLAAEREIKQRYRKQSA
jgi:Protein of unknown function (DUF2934)